MGLAHFMTYAHFMISLQLSSYVFNYVLIVALRMDLGWNVCMRSNKVGGYGLIELEIKYHVLRYLFMIYS